MGLFEIGRPRSSRWKNFGRRWTRGMMGLEKWTIFMDFVFVLSLMNVVKSHKTDHTFKLKNETKSYASLLEIK